MKKSWPNNLGDAITVLAIASLGTVLGVAIGVVIADVDNIAEWVGALAGCAGVLVAIVIAIQQLGPLVAEAKDRAERRNLEAYNACADAVLFLDGIQEEFVSCGVIYAAITTWLGDTPLESEKRVRWIDERFRKASETLDYVLQELDKHHIKFMPPKSSYTELSKLRSELTRESTALEMRNMVCKTEYRLRYGIARPEEDLVRDLLQKWNDASFRKYFFKLYDTYGKTSKPLDAYGRRIKLEKRRLEKLINEE